MRKSSTQWVTGKEGTFWLQAAAFVKEHSKFKVERESK